MTFHGSLVCFSSYCCSVVGAIIISIGFYAVLWGKAKEAEEKEMGEDCDFGSLGSSSHGKTPLLRRNEAEDM